MTGPREVAAYDRASLVGRQTTRFRQGRRCRGAVYDSYLSAPEQCVEVEGHEDLDDSRCHL